MKNILIYISLLVFSINLNAQKGKTIESKKFDDITVALGQMEQSKKYRIKITFPTKFDNSESVVINSKNLLYEIMDAIDDADTRKGFHKHIRLSQKDKYGNVKNKIALQIRHGKKSKYIGIGKVWNFKYGNYGVLRENAQHLYNYLNKLKTYL
ncbi:hypothetical protein [uncultured Polaribacter sp.]|jgi:hypothetical protein|uniref:hypothetical protein n=1 Tax=uncultured Polaribacter sp. TaxID=174711 RepID=UPI002634E757|nr:hypothetical protein [uncultured Polaribacter sp.]